MGQAHPLSLQDSALRRVLHLLGAPSLRWEWLCPISV